eukprot:1159366-Pelagomonas_calceolata.AAC.3
MEKYRPARRLYLAGLSGSSCRACHGPQAQPAQVEGKQQEHLCVNSISMAAFNRLRSSLALLS